MKTSSFPCQTARELNLQTQPNTRESSSRDLSNGSFQPIGATGAACCLSTPSAVKLAANSKAALSPWWEFQA